jgi:hypothetical protein
MVTPGSLQTISSLYDVSEQARDRSHMQFVFSPKDNAFPKSLNQPSVQFGTLDCISNQERPAKSTLFGTLDRAMRSRKVCQTIQDGGAYRDRTDDPLLAKQVLSQLS